MSDFGSNIRRISRYEKLLKLINEARSNANQPPKDRIQGSRSEVFETNSFLGGALSGVGSGGTGGRIPRGGPGGPGGGGSGPGGGSSGGSSNNGPSSGDLDGDNGENDGWYDADSILENTLDAFGNLPPAIGDIINSITGLQTDGEDRNIITHLLDAALAFIPPDDWDGPFAAGPDQTFQYGYYWSYAGFNAATPEAALVAGLDEAVTTGAINSYTYGGGSVTGTDGGGNPNQYTYSVTLIQTSGNTYTSINVIRNGDGSDCSGTQGSLICPASAPESIAWQDLLYTQLAWMTPISPSIVPQLSYGDMGKFIPNPYDVSVPPEYQQGASILDMKTSAGNPVRIGPTRAGGFYLYYRDPGNSNLPTGAATDNSVYLVNPGRTAAGFITPNQLATLLPV